MTTVEAVSRVLDRLGGTPDDRLEIVLARLLPALIENLNTDKTDVRIKLVEVLSHVTKRVKPNAAIKLPCREMIRSSLQKSTETEGKTSTFALNFAVVFIEMGLPRESPAEQGKLAVEMMNGIASLPKHSEQQSILLNLLLTSISHVPAEVPSSGPKVSAGALLNFRGQPQEKKEEQPVGEAVGQAAGEMDVSEDGQPFFGLRPLSEADANVVVDFLVDLALFPGMLTREGGVYFGLSQAGVARLTLREKTWARDLLTTRKLQLLRLLKMSTGGKGLLLPTLRHVVPIAIMLASDTHHEVTHKAEDLLKSIASADRSGAVLNDVSLAKHLLTLALGEGGAVVSAGWVAAKGPYDARRSCASAQQSLRVVRWLMSDCTGGLSGAGCVSEGMRMVFHCLLGPADSVIARDQANFARLRAAGASLAAFLASRYPMGVLPLVAPLLVQAVQKVLEKAKADGADGSDAGADGRGAVNLLQITQRSALMEGCYETIASLARRYPSLFCSDCSIARLLFREASSTDPNTAEAGLRVKVSAALGALRTAYTPVVRESLASASTSSSSSSQPLPIVAELRQLIWTAALSVEHRARLVAVEWACALFPFSDVFARHICIFLSDDGVTAVRSAANRGLQPTDDVTPSTADTDATTTTAPTQQPPAPPPGEEASMNIAAPMEDEGDGGRAAAGDVGGGNGVDFVEFVTAVLGQGSRQLRPVALAKAFDFSLRCAVGAQQSEEECCWAMGVLWAKIKDALETAPSATDPSHGQSQLLQLHRTAARCMQTLIAAEADRGNVKGVLLPPAGAAKELASQGVWLQRWLAHDMSMDIREAFAEVAGCVALHMTKDEQLVPFLRALRLKVEAVGLTGGPPGAAPLDLDQQYQQHQQQHYSNRTVAAAHGAIVGLGCIIRRLAQKYCGCTEGKAAQGYEAGTTTTDSSNAKEWQALCGSDMLPRAMCAVGGAVGHPVTLLHLSACDAAGKVSLLAPVAQLLGPLPLVSSSAVAAVAVAAPSVLALTPSSLLDRLLHSCRLGETDDANRRCEVALEAVGRYCTGLCLDTITNGTREGVSTAAGADAASGGDSGSRSADTDGKALVLTAKETSELRMRALEALVGLAAKTSKSEQLQLAGGDAIAEIAKTGSLLVSKSTAAAMSKVLASSGRADTSQPMEVEEHPQETATVKGKEAVDGDGDAKAQVDAMDYVLYRLVYELLQDNSPNVSGAATVYMLCVVNSCGRHRVLQPWLPDLQSSFTRQLTVRSEFVQEAAGKGLAAVYEAADDAATKRLLVEALVGSLSTGRKSRPAAAGVDVVGGAGPAGAGLSEAGASAYSEMCAVASDAGQPELIYSFLSLSSHHAAWTTRRGASFGLSALIGGLSPEALKPHLKSLVPRLYRYRFDPNAKTRTAMAKLWQEVVTAASSSSSPSSSSSAQFVREYFGVIMDSLLTAVLDRKWRERQGACLALAELIRGQGWTELGPYMEQLWSTLERVLDDIKQSVAEAAAAFAKSLSNTTARLCDGSGRGGEDAPSNRSSSNAHGRGRGAAASRGSGGDGGGEEEGHAEGGGAVKVVAKEEAAAAVGVVLPWLLNKGLMSRSAGSHAVCMHMLQRVVKVADGDALRPHLAELIATLIEGLSALEPQALQYLQFHAESQLDMTQEQMERLRLSLSRAGPLQEALEGCYKHLEGETQVVLDLMPRLMALLRSGVGLATRSGSAYLVLALCEKAPIPVSEASTKILQTLTNAALSERSATLRKTYASALAAVAKLAPPAKVRNLAWKLARLFEESDPAFDHRTRRTTALLLKELATRATGAMCKGDTWALTAWARILPLALVARYDDQPTVKEAFEAIWEEGLTQLQLGVVSTDLVHVKGASDAITELMLTDVTQQIVGALSSGSRSTWVQGCKAVQYLSSQVMGVSSTPQSKEAWGEYALVVLRLLLRIAPGRVWEGKEEVLAAMVELCRSCKGAEWLVVAPPNASVVGAGGMVVQEKEEEEEEEEAKGGGQKEPSAGEGAVEMEVEGGESRVKAEVTAGEVGVADGEAAKGEDTYQYQETVVEEEGEEDEEVKRVVAAKGAQGAPLAQLQATAQGTVMVVDDVIVTLTRQLSRSAGAHKRRRTSVNGDAGSDSLPRLYKRAAAQQLAALLNTFPEARVLVYGMLQPVLMAMARLSQPSADGDDSVAEGLAVACMAALWPRSCSDGQDSAQAPVDPAVLELQKQNAAPFVNALLGAMKHKVWSVRVQMLGALETLLKVTDESVLATSGGLIDKAIAAATIGARDEKYAKARTAGVAALLALCQRKGNKQTSVSLSLLPHKEDLLKLANDGADDPSPAVATVACKLRNAVHQLMP